MTWKHRKKFITSRKTASYLLKFHVVLSTGKSGVLQAELGDIGHCLEWNLEIMFKESPLNIAQLYLNSDLTSWECQTKAGSLLIICAVFLFTSCFNLTAQGRNYSKGSYILGIFGMSLTRKLVEMSELPFSRDFHLNQGGLHPLPNHSKLRSFVVCSRSLAWRLVEKKSGSP